MYFLFYFPREKIRINVAQLGFFLLISVFIPTLALGIKVWLKVFDFYGKYGMEILK
jgi:hypothetical protein